MNINTIYFRAALTLALVWIIGSAGLSYYAYSKSYRSAEDFISGHPPDTDDCPPAVLDFTKEDFRVRRQTAEELTACYRNTDQKRAHAIEDSNHFALKQAWNTFLWKGALPSMLILAFGAFWPLISTNVGRATSGYFSWLRSGKVRSSNVEEDEKR